MRKHTLRIRGDGAGRWLVCDLDGRKVKGPFGTGGGAEGYRAREEERAQRTPRSCITCGTGFSSEGAHHRMCDDCRGRRSQPTAQFEGF